MLLIVIYNCFKVTSSLSYVTLLTLYNIYVILKLCAYNLTLIYERHLFCRIYFQLEAKTHVKYVYILGRYPCCSERAFKFEPIKNPFVSFYFSYTTLIHIYMYHMSTNLFYF